MDFAKLKVLVVDDSVYKAMDISRALEYCGISKENIVRVRHQEAGFEKLYEGEAQGVPFELIVTDMQYPLDTGKEEDTEAGFKLIERLKEEGMDIPVIICSSLNYTEPEILGCVWYNEMRDLNRDFREVLKGL